MSVRHHTLATELALVTDDIRLSENRLTLLANQLADAQEHSLVARLTTAIQAQRDELERHQRDYAEIAKRMAEMSSKADLVFLEQKLSAASGPDRKLDISIATMIGGWRHQPDVRHNFKWHDGRFDVPGPPPIYTESLDAAIALVERVCPPNKSADHAKSEIRMQIGDWGCNVLIDRDTFSGDDLHHAQAPTPALALCLALVRSLQKENGHS